MLTLSASETQAVPLFETEREVLAQIVARHKSPQQTIIRAKVADRQAGEIPVALRDPSISPA